MQKIANKDDHTMTKREQIVKIAVEQVVEETVWSISRYAELKRSGRTDHQVKVETQQLLDQAS